MTDDQMVKAITEAYEDGHITHIEPDECNSKCGDCPSKDTCEYLSGEGNLSMFTKNYKALLERRPELKELDDET